MLYGFLRVRHVFPSRPGTKLVLRPVLELSVEIPLKLAESNQMLRESVCKAPLGIPEDHG